jgi:hypothetical protein
MAALHRGQRWLRTDILIDFLTELSHLIRTHQERKTERSVRPGAGRPKGSTTRRLRAIADMTAAAMKRVKKVPLDTMLKNMERFDEEADGLYAKLNDLIENGRPLKKASPNEHLEFFDKVMSLMGKMRECRLDAQRCATDAAPYTCTSPRGDPARRDQRHHQGQAGVGHERRGTGRLLQQAAAATGQLQSSGHRKRYRRAGARERGVMRGVRDTFVPPVRTTQSFVDSMNIVRSYVLGAQRC